MTAARDQLRMTASEIDGHLRAGSVGRVATVDASGAPHVVPVAYVMLDGALAFWADPASQKVVNLRRDPRLACVVDAGTDMSDLRGVELRGTARLVDDPTTSDAVAVAFAAKAPEAFREAALAQLRELARQRVVILVAADHVISWDHRKLAHVRAEDIGH